MSENDEFVFLPVGEETTLDLYPCHRRWRNLSSAEDAVEVCVEGILRILRCKEDLAIFILALP
jgi:hypothetical protein